MSHTCRTKTQGKDRFSRNRPFSAQGRNLWASWSDSPTLKINCEELDWSWKFHQNNFIPSKVIQLFNLDRQTDSHTDTQTDRHTNPHPYTGGRNFLCRFLIPFTSLRSLRSLRLWRINIPLSDRKLELWKQAFYFMGLFCSFSTSGSSMSVNWLTNLLVPAIAYDRIHSSSGSWPVKCTPTWRYKR